MLRMPEGRSADDVDPPPPTPLPTAAPPTVPCLKRAADVSGYNPNNEFAVQGEEDWVATHEDPACQAPGGGDDDIPSIDDAGTSAKPAGAGASTSKAGGDGDDVPDISELELGDADDEVRGRGAGGGV